MGTSVSPGQLAGKLNRLAQSLGDTRGPLNVTGMAGKRIFVGAAGPVIGARVAGRRKAIGARYDVKPPTVTITYTGPTHLVNNPTRPHWIYPRRRPGMVRRRRGGSRALTIEGNVRASAHHPGTHGKGFYQKAKAVAVHTLPVVYGRAQLTEPLRKIF